MSPEAEAIKEVVDHIVEFDLWWALLQVFVAFVCVLMAHKLLKAIAAYISFVANKDIAKNVRIVIKGREAIITHFTIRFIFIRFKDTGNEMIIPMAKWEDHDWELIKNGKK